MTNTAGRNETTHETSNGVDGGVRLGSGKGNRLFLITMVLLLGTATIVAAGWLGGIFPKTPAEIAKSAGVVETVNTVKIPLKALDSGKALFLRQEVDGRQLYYFALKSSDGAYRAAFDACDGCFRTNLGYRQKGDWIMCNKCEVEFHPERIE